MTPSSSLELIIMNKEAERATINDFVGAAALMRLASRISPSAPKQTYMRINVSCGVVGELLPSQIRLGTISSYDFKI